ncbi:response regulator transcription factor [Bordetella petrii]|uniref:response regulator transcription factor n=1 Tax=Bordetella petrii TaxID=94624 RepID=UPI00047B31EE|nr:response regulator transcription factor [Bordetella petrii]
MTSVLIVDDHPSLRLVIRQQLSQMLGVTQIIEASNGQDAIRLVREAQPRLVVLDLDLPRLNGLDTIPRIKQARPDTRILVISAQDPLLYAPRVRAAGAQGYISKTQDVTEIVRAIETVLAGYSVYPDDCAAPQAAARPAADVISLLSDREITVTKLLASGMSNKAIGETLFISNKTVSTYKTRLMAKLGVRTLVELVDFARKNRIVS